MLSDSHQGEYSNILTYSIQIERHAWVIIEGLSLKNSLSDKIKSYLAESFVGKCERSRILIKFWKQYSHEGVRSNLLASSKAVKSLSAEKLSKNSSSKAVNIQQ